MVYNSIACILQAEIFNYLPDAAQLLESGEKVNEELDIQTSLPPHLGGIVKLSFNMSQV